MASRTQFANKITSINHSLIRETLKYFRLKEKLHIATYSTVPTNTGLGTSSAMIVGLINCIRKFKNLKINDKKVIKIAFKIERKICNQYGGWQDQVISQTGGLAKIDISKNENIKIKKYQLNKSIEKKISDFEICQNPLTSAMYAGFLRRESHRAIPLLRDMNKHIIPRI